MFKILKWLMPLAAALTLSATNTASAQMFFGDTQGRWDLPAGPLSAPGAAEGPLVNQFGVTQFYMNVNVYESFSGSPSIREGTYEGSLDDFAPGSTYYYVYGLWSASALNGDGEFDGRIFRQLTPFGPLTAVGKMKGKFEDPFPSGISGEYQGEWMVVL